MHTQQDRMLKPLGPCRMSPACWEPMVVYDTQRSGCTLSLIGVRQVTFISCYIMA